MKEPIVKLETAELAKEKRFNIESNQQKGYNKEDGSIIMTGYSLYVSNEDFDITGIYAAPSQSLLQKWLREVHNIQIDIQTWNGDKPSYVYNISYVDDNKRRYTIHGQHMDIWEDALEDALIQALNKIK